MSSCLHRHSIVASVPLSVSMTIFVTARYLKENTLKKFTTKNFSCHFDSVQFNLYFGLFYHFSKYYENFSNKLYQKKKEEEKEEEGE